LCVDVEFYIHVDINLDNLDLLCGSDMFNLLWPCSRVAEVVLFTSVYLLVLELPLTLPLWPNSLIKKKLNVGICNHEN
jgi:hypothetical protein